MTGLPDPARGTKSLTAPERGCRRVCQWHALSMKPSLSVSVTTGVTMTSCDRERGEHEREVCRTHVSAARLRARGWTAGLVRRLLGEPDALLAADPRRPAPQVRLYAVERVEAAERSREFRAARAATARRPAAVRAGTVRAAFQRRRREASARLTTQPADVPRTAGPELHATLEGEQGARGNWGADTDDGADHRWVTDRLPAFPHLASPRLSSPRTSPHLTSPRKEPPK